MRWLSVLFALAPTVAFALPSGAVVKSCLASQAQSGVTVTEIPFQEINEEDDYRPGYTAEYVLFNGAKVGAATSNKGAAILYREKLYPVAKAVVLAGAKAALPEEIHVELASWAWLKEGRRQYLCVSDNFDGIGRSGSFQKIRYGYLLEVRKGGKLFYTNGVLGD
ncbi:hypothetical protein HA052_19485 [Chromobacterium haemolyticum]|uniref:Uncharacterized protein n=1 Tax=Chromobacterium fluminis TaxID=3044269 RepID=A0ABX0LD91_9NEIS|nr:hypothetical protein [Chromobacterium haemolyticum]NHR07376.1 hypothetical protein [Chromobacterium haemolyticum]